MSIRASAMRCSHTEWSDSVLAEGDARLQPLDHLGQRFFGDADGAHAVVDAARPKAPLGDLEPAALAQQHVAGRDADVR
jgi:hypothetical protein